MGTYYKFYKARACYKHRITETVELPYSFQCESCGKDSGSLIALIFADSLDANYTKDLSAQQKEKLCREAHKNLVKELRNVHKDVVEKQIYPTEFHDNCPFCHEPQSWAVSGLIKLKYDNPVGVLGAGAFFGLWLLFLYFIENDPVMKTILLCTTVGVFAAGALSAIGCLIWNIRKIDLKTKQTSSGVRHLPVIEWGVVQHLLDER